MSCFSMTEKISLLTIMWHLHLLEYDDLQWLFKKLYLLKCFSYEKTMEVIPHQVNVIALQR